jgi:hypothetical protein
MFESKWQNIGGNKEKTECSVLSPCSRPNWDPPPPHPQAMCPSLWSRRGHTRLREGVDGGPSSDEGTDTVISGIHSLAGEGGGDPNSDRHCGTLGIHIMYLVSGNQDDLFMMPFEYNSTCYVFYAGEGWRKGANRVGRRRGGEGEGCLKSVLSMIKAD